MYQDEDGYWIVECPSLKGCNSQGKTKGEALSNIKEAITGYINALNEEGIAVPTDNFETFLVILTPPRSKETGIHESSIIELSRVQSKHPYSVLTGRDPQFWLLWQEYSKPH